MKKIAISLACVCFLLFTAGAGQAATFLSGVSTTGGWHDADKTYADDDDDLLCWAATASNMLRYGNWNAGTGYLSTDDIFGNFQDHWTNEGGRAAWGIQWWFDGSDPSGGGVDVPGGGGYWSTDLFNASYSEIYGHTHWSQGRWVTDPLASAMGDIESYILNGAATGLSISTGAPGVGHAVTVWGHELLTATTGTLWITDSDDYDYLTGENELMAVAMLFDAATSGWYLQDYAGSDAWYIRGVYGLAATPIPGAVWLLGSGLIGLVGLRRKYMQ